MVLFCAETTLSISEGPASQLPPDENGIVFNYELFTFDTRVFLYSVDFTVVLEQPVDENAEETIHELCIIGFLGEDSQLVAQTDVHRYITVILSLVPLSQIRTLPLVLEMVLLEAINCLCMYIYSTICNRHNYIVLY